MVKLMTVSVIIPTYNGAHKVTNALDSILNQTIKPNEIILVIDGSTDNTKNKVEEKQYPFLNFRIIEQENGGRAIARNNGAKNANGKILLFLDDDMLASKDWVKEHCIHHQQYPNTLVTGREEASDTFVRDEFGLFLLWLHRNWTKYDFEDGENDGKSIALKSPYITASNFSIPKTTFFELGGFDSQLRDAEDFDLAIRAKVANKKVFYNYSALAFNNEMALTSCSNLIKRHREYQTANDQLRNINSAAIQFRQKYIPSFPKNLVFKLVCNIWWINSVEKEYWKWLPQNVRFKLYDIIITANGTIYPNIVKLKQ